MIKVFYKLAITRSCLLNLNSHREGGHRFQHAHLANNFRKNLAIKLIVTLSYNVIQYLFIKDVFLLLDYIFLHPSYLQNFFKI